MREKITVTKGIMLGRMIPFLPGNFLGTGSSDLGARRGGAAKDAASGAGRGGAMAVVAVVREVDGAVVVVVIGVGLVVVLP